MAAIHYLATRDHLYTIEEHLAGRGAPLRNLVEPMAYEDLFAQAADEDWWRQVGESWWPLSLSSERARVLPPGAYVFADVERLSPFDATRAAIVWKALAAAGERRLYNHPTRSMRRYELLRTLYEIGANRFDIYRLTEARYPARYPVFIRDENDHRGARFPLINSREELDEAIALLDSEGRSREGVVIVEFLDTSGPDGVFRKYGAFVVAGRIVPKNVLFSADWVVKIGWGEAEPALAAGIEDDYVSQNPHTGALEKICRQARIDYGRVDYAVIDGSVQVWEINTNPMITAQDSEGGPTRGAVLDDFANRFEAAIRGLL